jgi:hypothetical protein
MSYIDTRSRFDRLLTSVAATASGGRAQTTATARRIICGWDRLSVLANLPLPSVSQSFGGEQCRQEPPTRAVTQTACATPLQLTGHQTGTFNKRLRKYYRRHISSTRPYSLHLLGISPTLFLDISRIMWKLPHCHS